MRVNDEIILEQLTKDQKTGFRLLFNSYYQPLCYFALKYLDSVEQAEEVVQDALIKFWEKRSFMEVRNGLNGYLHTTIKNAALNYLRKQSKYRFEEVESLAIEMVEEEDFEDDEYLNLRNKLFGAINELPPKTKAIFKSIVLDDLKHREAAELYGVSVNTVKTHYLRALQKLRGNLKIILMLCGY